MSDLFRKLKENNPSGPASSSQYGFQGGGHPFRDRPGTTSTTSSSTMVRQTPKKSKQQQYKRTEDGDRPPAYQPPAVQDPGTVVDWEPPGFGEMLKDLGLRVLEVGIAAAAMAAGEEVAYFFRKRRMFTDEQRRRRDWR